MFDWDDEKAAINLRRHGVSFEQAKLAFSDPLGLSFEDDRFRYDETRIILMGVVENRMLTFVYAEEDDTIRIISAREAEPRERPWYHEGS